MQLARAAGAQVLAAAGGPAKLRLASELGAAAAADYRKPEWPAVIRSAAGGADVGFDGVGGQAGRAAFELLAPGGRLLSYGLASGAFTMAGDEEATARQVTVCAPARPISLPPRPAITPAASGSSGMASSTVGFTVQPFRVFRSSTLMLRRSRNSTTRIASPMADSAAATVRMKNTNTWPLMSCR